MSEHRITVKDFPRRLGEGDAADTKHETVDIVFNFDAGTDFTPFADQVTAVNATIVGESNWDITDKELLEQAQQWLEEDGYDRACDLADSERQGDYE